MHHGQYLMLLGGCLLLTLPLEFLFRARVYRRPWLTVRAIGVILVLFGTWDAIAYARHHWSYDLQYFLGPELLGGLPLEELLFFVVIPLCALLTYGAVGTCLDWARRLVTRRKPARGDTTGQARDRARNPQALGREGEVRTDA